jgi:hypothetical protein
MLEWVPAGLNTGALSGAKASSSRTRDSLETFGLDFRESLIMNEAYSKVYSKVLSYSNV